LEIGNLTVQQIKGSVKIYQQNYLKKEGDKS